MDVWKQFLGAIVRYGLMWLAGVLVSKEIISNELADTVVTSATGVLVIFILSSAPILWSFLKVRWNKFAMHEALNSPAGTTLNEVKKKVNNEKGLTVTSV